MGQAEQLRRSDVQGLGECLPVIGFVMIESIHSTPFRPAATIIGLLVSAWCPLAAEVPLRAVLLWGRIDCMIAFPF